ncbi:hypothetical protein EIP86_008234 [Pleurotus ostreatoroseus]|nr:hypothetical protein EIP86_008234 [Pleurotus ostreatoroseus]
MYHPRSRFNEPRVSRKLTRFVCSFWLDPRIYPAYVAALSVVWLVLHGIFTSKPVRKLRAALTSYTPPEDVKPTIPADLWERTFGKTGSITIFVFKFVRLLATIALTVLVLYTAWKDGWTKFDMALGATLIYSLLLAIFNAFANTPQGGLKWSAHLTLVTFAVFVLYCYRDIWPLMTFTLRPADEAEGDILWAKIALVFFVSSVGPLFEPYPYIPVDPTDPMTTPNPEQTASMMSFLFYSFLDPLIWLGYRVPHISHDQLPPQCDYDYAKNLIKRSYPYLDPFSGAKKRHLFWGILVVFRRSLGWQSLVITALTGGEDATVKPWVWILWIVVGPLFQNIFFQLYIYLSTGSLVRVESIITSLVFDHALRIRLKAEVSEDKDKDKPAGADDASSVGAGSSTKGTNSPDTGSLTGAESEGSDDNATAHSRSTTAASTSTVATVVAPAPQGKDKAADVKKGDKKEEDKKEDEKDKKGSNLVGKINNLVTSDLEHITEGRDFLFLGRSLLSVM